MNIIVRPHPNKNNNNDILLPANNIAVDRRIINNISNGFFNLLSFKKIRIAKKEKKVRPFYDYLVPFFVKNV